MANNETDPERVRVIRELLAEAESETSHTTEDAIDRHGAVKFLHAKLTEAGRVNPNDG
ncbi:hypothetical protein SEA_SATIS_128 [Streptomyces phage Satis]|nr:hypothetical protein SEA_SATIS_128 [Streptomyces phage Satis]QBZ72026.1 hypothetical protein SEA_KRADAL_128 [Streptomyces phage Kradal]QPL14446.1 hypothetical protein SEA_EHYELIMAYOE_129 [Streptomyces phage EhyElimayoE]